MRDQDDASAADVKWSARTGFSWEPMTAQINEDAARLSRELRRKLAERLAGLRYQDQVRGAPVSPDVHGY